jgi:hypothetical protein
MCFKCGVEWHAGKCASGGVVNDRDYLEWAAEQGGTCTNCPQCKARIEKIPGGCNHLTCQRCDYQWCWICGAKYNEEHFNEWNVFGCSGMQFNLTISRPVLIVIGFIMFLAIPFLLLFKPVRILWKSFAEPLYFPLKWRWCCWCKPLMESVSSRCKGLCCGFFIYFLCLPLLLILGLILGTINCAIFVLPAWLYQVWRLLRIICTRQTCCLS